MKIHSQIEQGSFEWHLLRKNFITGSSVKRLMGKTTFESEVSNIIARRLAHDPPAPGYVSAEMERGLDLEPIARFEYELKTDNKVTQVGFVQRDEFCGLSPDGLVGSDGAIEIQCPDTGNHIHHIRMNISAPAKRWQIAHYFYCIKDLRWLDFISYDDRIKKSLFIKRIERKDVQDDIDKMTEVISKATKIIKAF